MSNPGVLIDDLQSDSLPIAKEQTPLKPDLSQLQSKVNEAMTIHLPTPRRVRRIKFRIVERQACKGSPGRAGLSEVALER